MEERDELVDSWDVEDNGEMVERGERERMREMLRIVGDGGEWRDGRYVRC